MIISDTQLVPLARRHQRTPSLRRGFSFTEVLFAVMILGIGFIMIAGIFPVAISQTASSQEETIAAGSVRGAVAAYNELRILQNTTVLPNTGKVVRLTDDGAVKLWSYVKGNQISPDNPRFGWAALVKRDVADFRGQVPSTAQLIVIPCQVRDRSTFEASDLIQDGSGDSARATLLPLTVDVEMTNFDDQADRCKITGAFAEAAAPGAVVVLSEGSDGFSPPRECAGRIYKLADLVAGTTDTYELLPGNDLATASEAPTGQVKAFIVGRASVVSGASRVFQGPSIAVGAYVTYIPLK